MELGWSQGPEDVLNLNLCLYRRVGWCRREAVGMHMQGKLTRPSIMLVMSSAVWREFYIWVNNCHGKCRKFVDANRQMVFSIV